MEFLREIAARTGYKIYTIFGGFRAQEFAITSPPKLPKLPILHELVAIWHDHAPLGVAAALFLLIRRPHWHRTNTALRRCSHISLAGSVSRRKPTPDVAPRPVAPVTIVLPDYLANEQRFRITSLLSFPWGPLPQVVGSPASPPRY
jgi:hypothetical protein